MSKIKTISLRVDERVLENWRSYAKLEDRTLSGFIRAAVGFKIATHPYMIGEKPSAEVKS